ncbi:MAG: NAD(P)/FAD-dependent oxidoreductase [Oscillospiraceae bacterium]|jgi:glycerol-3-phosphate dehydrogenase|nr:NAD(P)/FAD-dependent oxidoreductase [Oscillospiraceae bacterium]
MLDVLIIGCGITGASVAYELSRYNLLVHAVDRLNDIAGETTRANSGIIHAGYDPKPGTITAHLNVRGNEMIHQLCTSLDVPYKQNGSLVIGFDDKDKKAIDKLYDNGIKNKVPGIKIISAKKAQELEPNLSEKIITALYAPTGGIVSPWELAVALAETAAKNGVKFTLNAKVTKISHIDGGYLVTTTKGEFKTRAVVNAAGLYADDIHGLLKKPDFKITPIRGQYYLLDKSAGGTVSHTIFQCPNEHGKGVLVTPTAHGNLLIGPSSEDVDCRENTDTDASILSNVLQTAKRSIPELNTRENIRNFAGVRAAADTGDFIIREAEKHFYDLAGIKSPGLTAAPAIAEELIKLIEASGIKLSPKDTFINERRVTRFMNLSTEERAELIKKNPAYGRMVCRCENITEGEILDAFDSPLPPTTLDAIKRRCHAGMGRCQGGFCSPKTIALIAKRFGIDPTEVVKDRQGSYILTGEKGRCHNV